MAKEKKRMLGIELPWDWCLVKGSELRGLQSELRDSKFKAGVRARLIARLYQEIGDKYSPRPRCFVSRSKTAGGCVDMEMEKWRKK